MTSGQLYKPSTQTFQSHSNMAKQHVPVFGSSYVRELNRWFCQMRPTDNMTISFDFTPGLYARNVRPKDVREAVRHAASTKGTPVTNVVLLLGSNDLFNSGRVAAVESVLSVARLFHRCGSSKVAVLPFLRRWKPYCSRREPPFQYIRECDLANKVLYTRCDNVVPKVKCLSGTNTLHFVKRDLQDRLCCTSFDGVHPGYRGCQKLWEMIRKLLQM